MSSECTYAQKNLYFSESELALLHASAIPRHIAIIMDGNRRWAKKQFFKNAFNPLSGHWAGANALIDIADAAQEMGIKVLTIYAFSTENWLRSIEELNTLFIIFETFLKLNQEKMCAQGVRFNVIGEIAPFPDSLKKEIEKTKSMTKNCEDVDLVVALNYGGRDEICRVVGKICEDIERGNLSSNQISNELISQYLDTAPFGDPDLLIRTSGEMRISNFLLWQLAYAEIYVTDVLWPDFKPRELFNAVVEFQKRQRRHGR